MSWYWIVLIIIGYFIVGSVLAGLMTWINEFDDEDLFPFVVLFWPITIPILFIYLLCVFIIDYLRI